MKREIQRKVKKFYKLSEIKMEENERYEPEMLHKVCPVCEGEFEAEDKNILFCSPECREIAGNIENFMRSINNDCRIKYTSGYGWSTLT